MDDQSQQAQIGFEEGVQVVQDTYSVMVTNLVLQKLSLKKQNDMLLAQLEDQALTAQQFTVHEAVLVENNQDLTERMAVLVEVVRKLEAELVEIKGAAK